MRPDLQNSGIDSTLVLRCKEPKCTLRNPQSTLKLGFSSAAAFVVPPHRLYVFPWNRLESGNERGSGVALLKVFCLLFPFDVAKSKAFLPELESCENISE